MPIWLLKAGLWLKKNWLILLAIGSGILLFVLAKKDPAAIADVISKIRKDHDDNVKEIEAANKELAEKKVINQANLEAKLKEIEEQKQVKIADLGKEKQAEVKKIIAENGDDLDELAKRLDAAMNGLPK